MPVNQRQKILLLIISICSHKGLHWRSCDTNISFKMSTNIKSATFRSHCHGEDDRSYKQIGHDCFSALFMTTQHQSGNRDMHAFIFTHFLCNCNCMHKLRENTGKMQEPWTHDWTHTATQRDAIFQLLGWLNNSPLSDEHPDSNFYPQWKNSHLNESV